MRRAIGHGERLELMVSPLDVDGFYDVDQTPDTAPFDPKGGGAWTLLLTGSIDGTTLDASFPVTFPSYPRVAVPGVPPADGTLAAASPFPGGLAWLIPAGALAALAGFALLVIVRRRRPGAPEAT